MGMPRHALHMPNCFWGARRGREAGLGSCTTSWTVRHNHPIVNLPSALAAAHGHAIEGAFDLSAEVTRFVADRYGIDATAFPEAFAQSEAVVPWSQSYEVVDALQPSLVKEPAAFGAWVAKQDEKPGQRAALAETLRTMRTGYEAARTVFSKARASAKRHADELDFWIEGVAHADFCAAVCIAALEDRLADEAKSLIAQLNGLREETRRLFSRTFRPASTDYELTVRYAFHEGVLKQARQTPR